jgi:CRISPR-associated protein Cmr6
MAIAAVPAYLLKLDLSAASPGLRFSMYLPLWGEDRRTRELLWSTHDIKYEIRNHEERALKHENKVDSWLQALVLHGHDKALMAALLTRQSALAAPLLDAGSLLVIHAKAVAPFTTGLGNEHPLENGFAFLNPYGLPYLPGSGVKGVLRQAACELESGAWGDQHGWTPAAIDALFGKAPPEGSDAGHQRGALTCWDVIPQLAGNALRVEVMTPHQSHYYQQDQTPHDSGSPNPISFLTVPPDSGFTFHLHCDESFLRSLVPELVHERRWQALLQTALEHAFAWLGFGAKTAVGYGAMAEDAVARQRHEQALHAARAAQAAHVKAEAQAAMSPEDRAWDQAQPALAAFEVALTKAKAGGPFNPGGPFNSERLAFTTLAQGWTEARSRHAAGELLAKSATKDWGRPSKKERWQELQQAIFALKGNS